MGWFSKAKKKIKKAAKKVKKNRVFKAVDVYSSTYAESTPWGLVASSVAHSGGNPARAWGYGKARVEERVHAGKQFFTGDWKGLATDVASTVSKRTGGSASEQASIRKLAGYAVAAKQAHDKAGGSEGLVKMARGYGEQLARKTPDELAGMGAANLAGLLGGTLPRGVSERGAAMAEGQAGRGDVYAASGITGNKTMLLAAGGLALVAIIALRR